MFKSLQFLRKNVLGFLNDWQSSIDNRPNFTKAEKNKMFLSHQTAEGIRMTGNIWEIFTFIIYFYLLE